MGGAQRRAGGQEWGGTKQKHFVCVGRRFGGHASAPVPHSPAVWMTTCKPVTQRRTHGQSWRAKNSVASPSPDLHQNNFSFNPDHAVGKCPPEKQQGPKSRRRPGWAGLVFPRASCKSPSLGVLASCRQDLSALHVSPCVSQPPIATGGKGNWGSRHNVGGWGVGGRWVVMGDRTVAKLD